LVREQPVDFSFVTDKGIDSHNQAIRQLLMFNSVQVSMMESSDGVIPYFRGGIV